MAGLRRVDTFVVGLIYLIAALACTRIPLLHSLGYESSLIFALIGSAAAALLTVNRIRRFYREPALDRTLMMTGVRRSLQSSLLTNLLLLLIPLVVLLANAVVVKNCSLRDGLLFYLLLPGMSVVFSTALAFFCVMHYRRSRIMFFLFMAISFCYALALGYFTPAIFSYNFFYGYFPGFTYDEGLSVTSTLVSFRLITLGLSAVLVWLGNLLLAESEPSAGVTAKGLVLLRRLVQPSERGLTVLLLLLGIGVYVFRCDLGYESTSGYIRSWLGGELRTKHFIIYYPKNLLNAEQLSRLADEHEFRYTQLLEEFSLPRFDPIESFLYPSSDAKLRLIGAGNTDFAKPWSRQLHITVQSAFVTLKHELTHVIAGKFGVPVIRVSLRMGLTEGLPMALEGTYGARTLDTYAAAMQQLNTAPAIETLLSPEGFLTQAPSVSYVLAGSFSRYLIDTYGIRPYLMVYAGEDWRFVYDRPLPILVQEWKNYLRTLEIDGTDLAATKAFFSRTSIFRKTCPRVVGERNRIAGQAFAGREYAVAESLYAIAYAEGGSFESLSGLATAAYRRGAYRTVDSILNQAGTTPEASDRNLMLALLHGDALWGMDSVRQAFRYYHTLRVVDLTDGLTEAASERLLALEGNDRTGLKRYFLSPGPDSVRVAVLDSLLSKSPHDPLLRYLSGRESLRRGDYGATAREMDSISLADQDPVLEALRFTTLGLASYFTGGFEKAREMFWQSLNFDDSDVAELTVNDWIDRCEWKVEHREDHASGPD